MSIKVKHDTKSYDTAGFVITLIAVLIFFMPYFGLPLAIMGLVLSSKSKSGLATTGTVLGIVGIILNSITLLILVIVLLIGGVA
jgi:hypothetical protein